MSPFISIQPNTDYFAKNVQGVIWFDENYTKLSEIIEDNFNTGIIGNITSPSNAIFAVVNVRVHNLDTAYFGNVSPKRIDFWQTLVETSKTNSVFPFSGRYPFSKISIESGAPKVIIAIYLDFKFEEGYSYIASSFRKNSKTFAIYRKPKDILVTSNNWTQEISFNKIKPLEGTNFDFLTNGKSWAIVNFNNMSVDEYTNKWDYDGFELDEKISKGSTSSNFVFYHDIFSQVLIPDKSTISLDYFSSVTKLTPKYEYSTFSGYEFRIGILTSPFRYLHTKVEVGDWVNEYWYPDLRRDNSLTTVLVQIKENNDEKTILFSKKISVYPIYPKSTKDIYLDLGEELSFPNKDLLLSIRFNAISTLFEANTSLNPTNIRGAYYTNGNITENTQATPVTNFDNYNRLFFRLYSSWELKNIIDNNLIDLEKEESNNNSKTTIDISLPDKIYAIVGDTLQLFFRGIIKAVDPYRYDILVSCQKGKKYPRYFEYTPTASDVGENDFAITIKDDNRNIIATKKCTLVTKNTIKSPSNTLKVACFGDSLTAPGTWCKEVFRRLTSNDGSPLGKGLSNIQFVGSDKIGNVGYFGRGGWSWSSFVTSGRPAYRFQVSGVSSLSIGVNYTHNGNTFTIREINIINGVGNILCGVDSLSPIPASSGVLTKVSGTGDNTITFSSYSQDTQNPLWDYTNNKLTFIPYANKYANGSIDVVYTLLSWNEQTAGREDFSTVISQIKLFADTLHSEFPNAKLKIIGIQVPSVTGGMGSSYGATGVSYADGYGMVVTALNQNKVYQDFANQYSSWIEFVNISSQFDTEYNMPYSETNVNIRSLTKEIIGTNGVHPNEAGYFQIADVIFRNFIANFCQ